MMLDDELNNEDGDHSMNEFISDLEEDEPSIIDQNGLLESDQEVENELEEESRPEVENDSFQSSDQEVENEDYRKRSSKSSRLS
jgi:hypothetical protein